MLQKRRRTTVQREWNELIHGLLMALNKIMKKIKMKKLLYIFLFYSDIVNLLRLRTCIPFSPLLRVLFPWQHRLGLFLCVLVCVQLDLLRFVKLTSSDLRPQGIRGQWQCSRLLSSIAELTLIQVCSLLTDPMLHIWTHTTPVSSCCLVIIFASRVCRSLFISSFFFFSLASRLHAAVDNS